MNQVIKRISTISFFLLIFTFLFIIIGIYFPMRNIIQQNNLSQFNTAATNITKVFKNEIEKNVQGSKSLSSRSAIRDKIIEYTDNKITFTQLAEYSQKKYRDGTEVLDNLLFSERIIDGKTLIQITNSDYDYASVSKNLSSKKIEYGIYNNNSNYELRVESPIIFNDKILGYDVLYFSLNKLISDLNTEPFTFLIIVKDKPEEDSNYLYYYETLDDGTVISLKASKNSIFSKVNEISLIVILRLFIFVFLIALTIYFFIIRFMNKKINLISQDRDIFKNKAIIDDLTGAYSRMYINTFIKQNKEKSCSVALIDLDNFKEANDKYGHTYGDELLKNLVDCTKNILRNEDAIIRLGGDEFLLIFIGIQELQARVIIKRIKDKIAETKIGKHLHFSFGVTFVANTDLLLDYIEQADARMYINKMSKKTHS